MTQEDSNQDYKAQNWEKISVLVIVTAIIFLVGYIIIRNEPFKDNNIVVFVRILLSLSISVLGAVIPGFLKIDLSSKGVVIRAGGTLALFVLTYVFTPKVLPQNHVSFNNENEAHIFFAALNMGLAKDNYNGIISPDINELNHSLKSLRLNISFSKLYITEEILNSVAKEINNNLGIVSYTKFNNIISITSKCVYFDIEKLPWVIGLELEELVKPLDLPSSFKRNPMANSMVWLKDIKEYYLHRLQKIPVNQS